MWTKEQPTESSTFAQPIEYNYIIAFKRSTGQLHAFRFQGRQVFFGTDDEAQWTLRYAKVQAPHMSWQIIKIMEGQSDDTESVDSISRGNPAFNPPDGLQ